MKEQTRQIPSLKVAGFCLGLCLSFTASSQEHLIHRPENSRLHLAGEQLEQGHYALAIQSAGQFLAGDPGASRAQEERAKEKARYIVAVASLKADAADAENTALTFLSVAVTPAYRQRTSFALGQYYFHHEQLHQAIPYYESADISNLTNQEIADSKFELAYCYFNSRQFDLAEPLFASIKEVPGKYYLSGNYYYGLLAYNQSKYAEALTSFERIQNETQYRNIVPYYIAEIYYFMGDRKKALEEAMKLTSRPEKLYYDNELHLLAAQILFEDKRYGEALPYFEHYYDNTDKIRKEELYEMAYSYYRVNEYKNAIEKFKPLSNSEDSLGQTAMYLLGDCYLKTGDKKSARNAFGVCADMPFNQDQQEASLLLYGKISFDLGFNDMAIKSLNTLITNFPRSAHRSEAKTLMSDLLIRTSNYADAYEALKDVTTRTGEYWLVQQKVTYGYALQQMRRGNNHLADSLLTLSLRQPQDNAYEAAAYFWKGDIAYKTGRPADALNYLKQFVSKSDEEKVTYLSPQSTLSNAYMDMGYAAMEVKDFAAAQSYFNRSRQGVEGNSSLGVIASLREADAAFMQKNFREAFGLYDKIIAANIPESDYARIQKAILLGIQNKSVEKIALLQQVISKPAPSPYGNDARYELANTYIEDEKYVPAINLLQPLTSNPEARNYAVKAWLKTGFAYQELDNNAKAIEAYKHVVTDFPASEDRITALESLRSLFIESNQPEAYAAFLKEYNLPAAGSEMLDSTYYAAAEVQIAAGRWSSARTALDQYLERYPNGSFMTKAHYYKGESHYQLKENEQALAAYDAVLALPWNEYSEPSAKRAADIAFNTGSYARAASYYNMLRNAAMSKDNLQLAYTGLMRAAYNSNEYESAALYADTLLGLPEPDETTMTEVLFFKAKALQRQKKDEEALAVYQQLRDSKNESVAAEARYSSAEIYFRKGDLKQAEEEAANVTKLNNDYWSIKSFLLIADILVEHKDYFNAKATLNSIIKNSRDAALKKQAVQKLDEVKKREKTHSKLKDE